MHTEAREFVERIVGVLPSGPVELVVELGSYNYNGGVRDLFTHARTYIGVDTRPGEGVDLVADAATVTLDKQADLVVSTETLEHVADPAAFMQNAYRLLRRGGFLILTTAGPRRVPHSALDGMTPREGEPYQNVTPDDLVAWWPEPAFMQANLARGGFDVYALAGKLHE